MAPFVVSDCNLYDNKLRRARVCTSFKGSTI